MKTYKLLCALLALIMLACLSGVQGQYYQMPASGYQMPAGGYQTTMPVSTTGSTSAMTSQYSQYYTMQAAPSVHMSAPVQFNIAGRVPNNLYFGTQNQAVPYAQYMSNPAYAGANSLWIQGTTDWTQYAVVPQGATLTLVAVTRMGGNGYITEIRPDGTVSNTNFYFYPYSQMTFYADTIGRHIISFNIGGASSNTVVIDVTGNYATPGNYLQPGYGAYNYPSYYNPTNYNPYYYQGYQSSYYPSYYPYYSGLYPYYYPYYNPYGYSYPGYSYPGYSYPGYSYPGYSYPGYYAPTTTPTTMPTTTPTTPSPVTTPVVPTPGNVTSPGMPTPGNVTSPGTTLPPGAANIPGAAERIARANELGNTIRNEAGAGATSSISNSVTGAVTTPPTMVTTPMVTTTPSTTVTPTSGATVPQSAANIPGAEERIARANELGNTITNEASAGAAGSISNSATGAVTTPPNTATTSSNAVTTPSPSTPPGAAAIPGAAERIARAESLKGLANPIGAGDVANVTMGNATMLNATLPETNMSKTNSMSNTAISNSGGANRA